MTRHQYDTIFMSICHHFLQCTGIELKLEQEKAIRGFIQGNDVFVPFPTGFGKSLWLLPGTFDRIRNRGHSVALNLVVSPLIAVITD